MGLTPEGPTEGRDLRAAEEDRLVVIPDELVVIPDDEPVVIPDDEPVVIPDDSLEFLRRRTEWMVAKPWRVVVVLAVLGLAVRCSWLSTSPEVSGDWHWPSIGRMLAWTPWPGFWDRTLGFFGQSTFAGSFRFPVFAINGLIARLGGSWTLVEKAVYFLPFAVLLPVAGWLLSREVLGPSRWVLLTPVLLLGNTYLMVETNGEIPLVFAEVLGCLALAAFLRAMRSLSWRWASATGLLLAAAVAMDVRPAYLTVWMMAAYVFVLGVTDRRWRVLRARLVLFVVVGGVLLGTQMFWILPSLTYHGNASLPTRGLPDFSIITMGHAITGVSANWTGGNPTDEIQAPLDPIFFLVPILAVLPLLRRRVKPELLWLGICAVIFAFLAKTDTPPLGGIYDFIFVHVPGFDLFREGSKFFYPVVVAYSIMIPAGLRWAFEVRRDRSSRLTRAVRVGGGAALAAVLALTVSSIIVLESGNLLATTNSFPEPQSFAEISAMLNKDHTPGAVLWFRSPLIEVPLQKSHEFLITSATHPVVSLTGNVSSPVFTDIDLLQYFCAVVTQPYCYLNPTSFPYLARSVGASYIVAPGGDNAGVLPLSVNRGWLRQQLTVMFGAPRVFGSGATSFVVWHISGGQPAVDAYPAAALVESGPWSLGGALPALQAMGIPAVYQQSPDATHFPPAPSDLPDTVAVEPRTDLGCWSDTATSSAVMVESPAARVTLRVAGTLRSLALLDRSARSPTWGLYGPVPLASGQTVVTASSTREVVGPCVSWSPLTATAFGQHTGHLHMVSSSGAERLAAAWDGPYQPWVELLRQHDTGWRLDGAPPTSTGAGIFNLYHVQVQAKTTASHLRQARAKPRMGFEYSTLPWERRGEVVAALTFLVALGMLRWGARRDRTPPDATRDNAVGSRTAAAASAAGLCMLVLTAVASALEWFGVPSRVPFTAPGSNPYGLDIDLGFLALVLLGCGLVVRVVAALELGPRLHAIRWPAVRTSRQAAAMVLAAILAFSGVVARSSSTTLTANNVMTRAALAAASRHFSLCIADYTAAIRLFPGTPAPYAGRSGCYRHVNANESRVDPAGAVQDAMRALALDSDSVNYLLVAAAAEQDVGNVHASNHYLLRAAAFPTATATDILHVVAELVRYDPVLAASVIDADASRFPSSPTIKIAAATLNSVGGPEATTAADMAAAARLPDPVRAQRILVARKECAFEVVTQQYAAASTTCNQAATMTASGPDVLADLATLDADTGSLDAALQQISGAVSATIGQAGPNGQANGVIGHDLPVLYEAEGRLDIEAHAPAAAIHAFTLAMAALPPESVDAKVRLTTEILTAERD